MRWRESDEEIVKLNSESEKLMAKVVSTQFRRFSARSRDREPGGNAAVLLFLRNGRSSIIKPVSLLIVGESQWPYPTTGPSLILVSAS